MIRKQAIIMEKDGTNYYLIASVLFFVLSLSQKAYCTNGDCGETGMGMAILMSGFLGLSLGGACLTWLANPILILSWALIKLKRKISLFLSLLSLIIGLSFLMFNEIVIDEALNYGTITGYKTGYWLWVLSMLTMVIGGVSTHIRIKSS